MLVCNYLWAKNLSDAMQGLKNQHSYKNKMTIISMTIISITNMVEILNIDAQAKHFFPKLGATFQVVEFFFQPPITLSR